MLSLLEIEPPKDKKYLIWEHAIKSVFAFSGTFALLIFMPLFIAAKSKTKHNNLESNYSADFIIYLSQNPLVAVFICGFITFFYNLKILYNNSQKIHVIGIRVKGDDIYFDKTNVRFQGLEETSLLLNDLYYEIRTKTVDESSKTQKLTFYEKKTNKVIGVIQPDHLLWNKHIKNIRYALIELSKLGVEKKTSQKNTNSMASQFFNE